MRIVHYIPDFGFGGIQKGGCVLAASMAKMGHEVQVIGRAGGLRYEENLGSNLSHRVLDGEKTEALVNVILEYAPDVLHIHQSTYNEVLVAQLSDSLATKCPTLVTSPVFGRPPKQFSTLNRTQTCCVGVYSFYRMCKWLNISMEQAVKLGIGYVPITPLEPCSLNILANDAPETVAARRSELGITKDAFIVGRIARNTTSKWHSDSEVLIETLLSRSPKIVWLSVGYPDELGRERLQSKWGKRFCNFPQTADYNFLCQVLACMDVQVFFSRHGECFASTICEAAGIGVPTIGLCTPLTDNGQSEQIVEGVTGMLINSIEGAIKAVESLLDSPVTLAKLKASTHKYAYDKWHVDRVSTNLLELYLFWISGNRKKSDYVAQMQREYAEFADNYRQRVAKLMGTNPLSHTLWLGLTAAVESWSIFCMGRSLKQVLQRT